MMRWALLVLSVAIAVACTRYEPAPGYESVARTPSPPECSDRPAIITDEPGSNSARTSASVTGIIVDERRRPVEGAQVSLLADSVLRTATDSAGQFLFAGAPKGPYRLVVRRIGYNPVDTMIRVPEISPMYRIVLPARTFDGPCGGVVVVVTKPWWKWW